MNTLTPLSQGLALASLHVVTMLHTTRPGFTRLLCFLSMALFYTMPLMFSMVTLAAQPPTTVLDLINQLPPTDAVS